MAAMLHARNNSILFLWNKMFILMQNIFIVPGMQHGRHAKPLFRVGLHDCHHKYIINIVTNLEGNQAKLTMPWMGAKYTIKHQAVNRDGRARGCGF